MISSALGNIIRVVVSIQKSTLEWPELSIKHLPQYADHAASIGFFQLSHDVPMLAIFQPMSETIRGRGAQSVSYTLAYVS